MTQNDVTFSKINIIQQKLVRKCILTLQIDVYHKHLKIRNNSRFFPIFSRKNEILRGFGTEFLIGTHIFEPIL